MPTDAEIAAELASSPTAQGQGSTPDVVQTDPNSLVAQPGDNASVDLTGNPVDIQMPEENARRGMPGVSGGTYVKSFKGAVGAPDLNTVSTPADLAAHDTGTERAVDEATARREAANNEEAAATQRYNTKLAELDQQQADLNKVWAGSEERSAAAGAAEAHKYIAAYEQQMAAVRQMAVDPTGPIGSMSGFQKAGLTLATFAQGFLAARGINIDVTGQIDKWVAQSIHEQERRIGQAQAGAEDQLHLLEIARQTSHDEGEARLRYRGMITAGIQAQITAQAATYKSDLATSQAAALNAQLDMDAVKTKQGIWNTTQERVEKAKQDKETEWFHRASIGVEWGRIQAEKEKAAAKTKEEPSADFEWIDDPETGKPTWAINKKDKEALKAGRESRAATGIMDKDLTDLKDAYERAYGKYGENPSILGSSKALGSSEVKEFNRARDRARIDLLQYGRIHKFSQTEFDALQNLMPGESAWQRGNNSGAIDELRQNVRNKFQQTMDTFAESSTRGQTAMPKLAEQEAVRQAGLKGAEAIDTPVADEQHDAERATAKGHPQFLPKPSTLWTRLNNPGPQPTTALNVDHLAVALGAPRAFRKGQIDSGYEKATIPDDDRELQKQAEGALRHIEVTAKDPAVRNHARRVLEVYHEQGATGVAALFPRDESETVTSPPEVQESE